MKYLFIALLFWIYPIAVSSQHFENWGDQGDGTYVNPVLPGDYSDLDAIRVGNDYYAISSTMQFSPGMVVLHSVDLINWKIIGHVVNDISVISKELNWDRMNCYGRGVWAGSIRYYNNRYWVYFGTPDDGYFMSSAAHPAGPWEPLHQVWKVEGWNDCCSFRDDDGQLYLIGTQFAHDPATNRRYNIHLFKMTPDGRSLIPESDTILYQAKGSEANKLYKINGMYYHYFSEVRSEGRVIMMRRSTHLYGNWETRQLNTVNPVTDKEPNQGGLLEVAPGKWCFLTHHGTGSWEGRVASLLPVNWIDGWPVIGEPGSDGLGRMVWSGRKPVTRKNNFRIETNDEFNTGKLIRSWEWNYQPRSGFWSLTHRKGHLRLYAFQPVRPAESGNIILRAGNTLTQRIMRTRSNSATIKLDLKGMAEGQHAGLTHFSTSSHSSLGVEQKNGKNYLVYTCNDEKTNLFELNTTTLWLRSSWDVKGINTYLYSLDGKTFVPLEKFTQLTWGSYRGDRIGIYNYNILKEAGFVDVDYFRYNYNRNKKKQ
jgi:beta-xylosidase